MASNKDFDEGVDCVWNLICGKNAYESDTTETDSNRG
jgi:hypothetical protein